MAGKEYFSSRWSLILAALGMVVGTGNIWRFPRIVARNGGGAFIIVWFLFLFLWSIPLLIIEFTMGKSTRKGSIGAFGTLLSPGYSWMGTFVFVCTAAIMFYYSVVMGWCLRFLYDSVINASFLTDPNSVWNSFVGSGWQPLLFHFIAISTGSFIVFRGIKGGIEKANNILIPLLLILLVIAAIRALTLPGAAKGLDFFFAPDWRALSRFNVWLDALTQSAWSTGAGWGLILTYAVYMRQKEDIVLNSFIAGLGNNAASILVGLSVFPAVFALAPQLGLDPNQVVLTPGPANTGLAFIWMPRLFAQMTGRHFFIVLFFLSLSIAALTSLIAMLELAVRNLLDLGFSRKKSILFIWCFSFVLGTPSALSLNFFNNQDWVWSLGLMVSGIFFITAVLKYGPGKFRKILINIKDNDLNLGKWFEYFVILVLPAEFILLLGWWFYQSIVKFEPHGWWHPFRIYSVGTCLAQWGIVLICAILLNKIFAGRIIPGGKNEHFFKAQP
ncbi:sodium-dependent transporter [candidate division KSB1 bacterium]|nr:sodium-dependent transporter [candidate division KSB1 bacterium]